MYHKRRIIHAISFEVGALFLLVTILSPLFDYSIAKIGLMGLAFSLIAVVSLYFYNLIFDKILLKHTGSMKKTGKTRVAHALLFEAGLVVIFLPLIMWWLNIGIIEALTIEAAGVIFMVVYTFVFHWVVEEFVYKSAD